MFPPKQLARFFLALVVVYAVLMAPWPGIQSGYAYLFRSFGNAVFARFWFWPDGGVRFLDIKTLKPGDLAPGTAKIQATGVFDTVMEMRSRRAPGAYGYLRTSSRYVGYGPTAVLIALIVATPVSWSRRGWALLCGLLLMHVFIALRLSLTLAANGFAADKPYALFHPSAFWKTALVRLENILSDDPTISFVVPAFVWLLVTLAGSLWTTAQRAAPSREAGGR